MIRISTQVDYSIRRQNKELYMLIVSVAFIHQFPRKLEIEHDLCMVPIFEGYRGKR